jgi:hypothetical protein
VVVSEDDHQFCVRHFYENYRDIVHRGVMLKDKLWIAIIAYTKAEFHKEIEELRIISVIP